MKDDTGRLLPFAIWWPLLGGAVVGIAVRFVFLGDPGYRFAAMSTGLLLGSPLLVGAVTVYLAEKREPRSWGYYACAAALANLLYVVGSLVSVIEGVICAVVVLPLFMLIGAVGGLIMGAVCRLTRWPSQTISCIAVLPFALALLERPADLPSNIGTVEQRVLIDASARTVWRAILAAPEIEAAEIPRAWVYVMGAPLPLAGVVRVTPEGPVRRVEMGRGIYFDELIEEQREPEYLRWRFRFYSDSFPAGTLDEHVLVGGEYFDFLDTEYRLVEDGARTELARISHSQAVDGDIFEEQPAATLAGDESVVDHADRVDFADIRAPLCSGERFDDCVRLRLLVRGAVLRAHRSAQGPEGGDELRLIRMR